MIDELMRAANKIMETIKYEDIVNWWRSKELNTKEDYIVVLEDFDIVCAYNSDAIEDIPISYHTTRELFSNGRLINYTGEISHVNAVQNQKYIHDMLPKYLANKQPISIEFILKIHEIMMRGCYSEARWVKGERPGTFKVNDYCIGSTNSGAHPDDVLEELTNLLNEINNQEFRSVEDVLIAASYFHLQFENIHPFADGNGRVGRVLTNYFLMINNLPPTVIFNEDKLTYYTALDVFDRTGKINGFIAFIKEQTLKTWKHVLENK